MTDKLSKLGTYITKNILDKTKKEEGIFFTPKIIIEENLNLLEKYLNNIENILEPSVGSGEFILNLDKKYNNINFDCIEKNKFIFDNVKKIEVSNNINFLNIDFMNYKTNKLYDLIIGNPPYFVILKNKITQYTEFIDGRPNIFILFILHSINLLKENGILSFILPSNFLNCQYYNKVRNFINKNCKILEIFFHNSNGFIDTKQKTISFIIKKNPNENNEKFIFIKNELIIFNSSDNIQKINELVKNSTNLSNLNCKVSIGSIVWNQQKNNLTDDNINPLLIYSTDIFNNKIELKTYKDLSKKRYIKSEKSLNENIIVINRGYGSGKYNFSFCYINDKTNFLIENHLIVISGLEDNKFKQIIESFNDERTKKFIELYFNNSSINVFELKNILPIYLCSDI